MEKNMYFINNGLVFVIPVSGEYCIEGDVYVINSAMVYRLSLTGYYICDVKLKDSVDVVLPVNQTTVLEF